jgi:hypothetical protein
MNKRVEIKLMLEVDDKADSLEIMTGVVDRIEAAAKVALPSWSALSDIRTMITRG